MMQRPRTMLGLRCKVLFVAILFASVSWAQQPRWSASVPSVVAKGLHAIVLTPGLLGVSRADHGDLRLLDSAGNEVPYVLRSSKDVPSPEFITYPLIENTSYDKTTVVELERPDDRVLEDLSIWIRPLEDQKRLRVTGSDDRKQWYMVKDDHLVMQGAMGTPPLQVLMLHLPPTDYKYLRIQMNDSLTPPMQVLGVGHFQRALVEPRYVTSEKVEWSQRDSASFSVIRVRGPHRLLIDRLRYTVSDTGNYFRRCTLRTWSERAEGRGRKQHTVREERTIASFVMGSDRDHVADIRSVRLDSFDLVIDNGDDRPLRFTELELSAREQLMLAHLVPGMNYRITTGDASLGPPHYDMAHFEQPTPAGTITPGALEALPMEAAAAPLFDPSQWWIWAVIIALMAGMGWMAWRMLPKDPA